MKPRIIEIIGDIGYVPLTRGLIATIDADDAGLVDQWNWYATSGLERTAYARRQRLRHDGNAPRRMHHIFLAPIPGMVVDHIDGNGLNNRRSNLRLATPRQNSRNSGFRKNGRPKGVRFNQRQGVYEAVLFVGQFASEQDATEAYDAALLRLFPNFGRPNKKRPCHPIKGDRA